MTLNDQIDNYFRLQNEIHEAFGYVEDWVVIPLDDNREVNWCLTGETGTVIWSDTLDNLQKYVNDEECDGNKIWHCDVYTQRFLPKWVYRTDDLTMICIDTQTDGNKFLMIFDNTKEWVDDS